MRPVRTLLDPAQISSPSGSDQPHGSERAPHPPALGDEQIGSPGETQIQHPCIHRQRSRLCTKELVKKVQVVHVVVSPLSATVYLSNLWLSPVAIIPKEVRRPQLILNFMWRRLNEITSSESPQEAMSFGGALQCILWHILATDQALGTVYISKVYLAYTYMRLLVCLEDVPYVLFLIQKCNTNGAQLVGFHLSLPMGFIDSAPYFCMAEKQLPTLPTHRPLSATWHSGTH